MAMDADSDLLGALFIMFTVIAYGYQLKVIIKIWRIRRLISALPLSVFAASVAWGLIRTTQLKFLLQRVGGCDQAFLLTPLHLCVTAPSLLLLFLLDPERPSFEGILRTVMTWYLHNPARLPSPLLFLVTTGFYGIGVFFARGPLAAFIRVHFSFYFTIALSLEVVVMAEVCAQRDPVGKMARVFPHRLPSAAPDRHPYRRRLVAVISADRWCSMYHCVALPSDGECNAPNLRFQVRIHV